MPSPTIHVMILWTSLNSCSRIFLNFNKSLKPALLRRFFRKNLDPSWGPPITSQRLSQFRTLCLSLWYLLVLVVVRGRQRNESMCTTWQSSLVWDTSRWAKLHSCEAMKPANRPEELPSMWRIDLTQTQDAVSYGRLTAYLWDVCGIFCKLQYYYRKITRNRDRWW